ncbi:MAG: nitroreductase [Deltaproteobacteria bacterium]|jgi:nitroreductase|nr:nitroreductase [Deltaproteobacteria bacterium]
MKNFIDLASARRSVRKYKSDPIPGDVLDKILRTGQLAPSGNNSQPWRFIIIDDEEVKRNLCEVSGKQKWIIESPITIAIVADMKSKIKPEFRDNDISIDDQEHREVLLKTVRDATIAADHMVMAATDEGLGTCWIALFEQDDIRPVLNVPQHCYVVAIITIGYPDEAPSAKPRKPLSDIASRNSFDREPWSC